MSHAERFSPGHSNAHDPPSMSSVPPDRPWRPHWAWLPAGLFGVWLTWERYGPFVSLVLVVLGLGVGIWVEYRARRRRANGAAR